MSILIKGMEMPKSCWRCTLSQLYEKPREMLVCKITHEEVLRYEIDGNCPLVPVPEHGRLIDADALKDLAREWIPPYNTSNASVVMNLFGLIDNLADNAPTIIPADKGGADDV